MVLGYLTSKISFIFHWFESCLFHFHREDGMSLLSVHYGLRFYLGEKEYSQDGYAQ